jgi:hypothetical protein
MMREDLIKQVAREISRKLLAGNAPPAPAQTLLIFDDEASDSLRTMARAAYPGAVAVTSPSTSSNTESSLAACATVVLVAPSLDLASKITLLQTDCPTANLVIRALLAGKRVIALTEGMLACTTQSAHPASGIFRAVHELRDKLIDLGIELVSADEPGNRPGSSVFSTSAERPARLPVLNPQSVAQHPSQQQVHVGEALNEFIDFLQTRECTMEKGKPCDKCDICNTLGF